MTSPVANSPQWFSILPVDSRFTVVLRQRLCVLVMGALLQPDKLLPVSTCHH